MNIGTGTTLSFASGFFAEILDVTPPGPTRKHVETSHMGTTNDHTFMPCDLTDWGECVIEMALHPGTTIPIHDAAEACVITFPDSASTTWTFNAFMIDFKTKDPLEDRMTATATLKVTGAVTVA